MISKRLKVLIKKKGISTEELSKQLNLSQSTIEKYINGKRIPKLKTLIKLSQIFNVSVDYLLGEEEIDKDDSKEKQLEKYIKIIKNLKEEEYNEILHILKILIYYYENKGE